MPNSSYFAIFFILISGTLMATQSPINAALARHLEGDALLAAFISFLVGTLVLLVLCLFRQKWPSMDQIVSSSWWMWIGGVLGAFVIVSLAWGVPQIGVLTAIGCIVFGQILGALILDASGAFGLAVQPVSIYRIAAVILIGSGVWLSRLS